jgi:ADP-dependent phosphofructokinase/glucokinase
MDFKKMPKNKMPITDDFYTTALKLAPKDENRAMSKLATLLEQYSKDSTYGYLFNTHSNID